MNWLIGITGLLALSAAGCLPTEKEEIPQGYLRLADKDDVPTLDPARGYDTASWQFEDLIFETLLDYDEKSQLKPELAENWNISADGLEYTFVLREDARFSSGRSVTAEDIRFQIRRVLNPGTQSPGAEFFRGILGADACSRNSCELEGISVAGPVTLRIRLVRADPLFAHKLAMPFAAAVPPEEVSAKGDEFGRSPVGSGQFVLREWRSGERLVFERRTDVKSPAPGKGVVRLVGVDSDLAWLKFKKGEIDLGGIPPSEFPLVVKDPEYSARIQRVATLRTQYLGLNCLQPPFADKRVRQALNFAVNKEKLLRLLNDRGVVARGIIPPAMPDFESRTTGYNWNPARARELLAEAGYAAGFQTEIWLRNDDLSLRLAQSIQQDLAQLGVGVRLKPLAWGPFLEAVKLSERVPMFLLGWEADFPDASNFLDVLLHSKQIGVNNNSNYKSAEVDALLEKAGRSLDREERKRLLEECESRAVDDAPWVFLYHPVTFRIARPEVRGLTSDSLRPDRLVGVWLEPSAVP